LKERGGFPLTHWFIPLDKLTARDFSAPIRGISHGDHPIPSHHNDAIATAQGWAFGLTMCVLAWAIPLQAHAASIVVDARTGVVLAMSDSTLPWPPASLTKLLTLYLTFAAIEDGSLKLDQELGVSIHAAGQRGSRLGLVAGDKITVRDAVLAVITQSGNDAAMVLAEAVNGNEATFVIAMNARAQTLGLGQSNFVNPTGLPDPRQTTSARDMALLARALWHDYPQHYHFFATRRMRFGQHNLPTINGFLASYRGADGLKTGTTCDAGFNLVASAERDGLRLIGVVLGAGDSATRSASMAKLLNEGFSVAVAEHGIDIATLRPSSSDLHRPWPGASACWPSASPPPPRPAVLPGWGLVLGAYAQEFRARRAIELVKASLSLPAGIGQPMVIPLKDAKFYDALLIGLDKDRATAACMLLRRSGAHCVTLTPSELNDLDAGWRG
jgi:D-alanyl-D-alanine carboxypeptidase